MLIDLSVFTKSFHSLLGHVIHQNLLMAKSQQSYNKKEKEKKLRKKKQEKEERRAQRKAERE